MIETLPYFDIELSGSSIDGIHITSTLSASRDAIRERSVGEINARDRLLTASTAICDFLAYRRNNPEAAGLQSVSALQDVINGAFLYLQGNPSPHTPIYRGEEIYDREFDSWSIASFEATDVATLKNSIDRVSEDPEKTVHIMPMANSAIPIALLTWDYISEGRENMRLHPVLFSRTKRNHQSPNLTKEETEYFKDCARRGDIFVILEEDTQSGDTVLGMMNYLLRTAGVDFSQMCGITPSYSRSGQHAILRRGTEGLEAELF